MAVVSLAQVAIVVATLVALSVYGQDFAPLAVAIATGLLLTAAAAFLVHRRFQALKEASRRLSLLAEMNVQVNREILLNEDIELIYRTILNYLFSVFDTATTGSILILGEDGRLTFAASRGFTEEFVGKFQLRLEDSFLYQITKGEIQEARLITRDDFARIETVFKPGQWDYQTVISAPLFVGDRLFGLLNLDSPVSGTYDAQDVEIVERFRTQIEIGLLARERYTTNIKRYQVDALTGLLTRRYFEDLFKLSLDRATRHQDCFVIALFDVDELKYVNDTFGHLAGDQMLLSVANVLRASCRNSDIIGRLGGDEFIASYHLTDIKAMEKNIANIRNRLRARTTRLGDTEHRLSFSYGLASFPEDGADQDTLIAAADKRLYAMKSASR
ncbi:sensor domain-containing diguanylate cyclase [Rhodoferax lacus]|uniref:GGDEF domain-containing protein n=1 Tax=Rhodoferax lacus TaxID=2184758 RepID=UPI0013147703|nr:GGDEF domain-containing protein [Rhodoferax lacus]